MLSLGTAIFIAHGVIIDGLHVARYGEPPISALAHFGGTKTFIVLDPDDEVKTFKGENQKDFHGVACCCKLEIETINGKKYGPFGRSPNNTTHNTSLGSYNTSLERLRLEVTKTATNGGIYLGPIKS